MKIVVIKIVISKNYKCLQKLCNKPVLVQTALNFFSVYARK